MNEVIYSNQKSTWRLSIFYLLLLSQYVFVIISIWNLFHNIFFIILYSLFNIILLYYLSKKEYSVYSIFDNKIEFYQDKDKLKKVLVAMEDIQQVRFEDDFHTQNDFFKTANSHRVFLYLKEGIQSELIKKDKIILLVSDHTKRKEKITKVLKHFQQKKIEVFVKTSHQAVLKELGIRNWDKP